MKRPSRKTLIRNLDIAVRELVFKRDKACVTCPIWREIRPNWNGSDIMQPGHVFTRGNYSTRWDLRNIYKQCKTCNFMHELQPWALIGYAKGVLGDKGFDKLFFDTNQAKPIKDWELQELLTRLTSGSNIS